MSLPDHLAALRDEALRTSCEAWAIRKRWQLSPGIDRAGPCPLCGGTDRFAINVRAEVFNCRRCGLGGKGVIELVMKTEKVEFTEACEIITGRKASDPIDEKRMAELRRQADQDAKRRAQEAEWYRERARENGYAIWNAGLPIAGTMAEDYIRLRLRRLPNPLPRFRFAPDLPYLVEKSEIHRGPALLAAVQRPDGKFGAVHRTWIDLSQPKGKAIIIRQTDGKEFAAKTVLGTKKGGAIRMFTPDNPRRIVMGEGIETTGTAWVHAPEPDTAYWVGVDGGNMSGKAARDAGNHRLHDMPDMTDIDCFLPPDWCEELIYLVDGDPESHHTLEAIVRGLRRAQATRDAAIAGGASLPVLTTGYVPPLEANKDLNDLVMV